MRVVIVSHTYFPLRYRGKLRWLATHGDVDLTLVALRVFHPPSRPELQFEQADEPFEVRFQEPLLFRDHNILRTFSPRQVESLLRGLRPDIVHVEAEPHSLTLALWASFRRRFGYRLVAFSWENLRQKGKGPLGWLESFSLRRVDAMVAGNHQARDVLRWRGYRKTIDVIPKLGLDIDLFSRSMEEPPPLSALPKGCRIGYVGRLVPQKGIMDLLEAFRAVAPRAVLILLGEGPLRAEIRRRATLDGFQDRLFSPGFVSASDIPAYLRALDVLVLPSRTTPTWKEQFGHVLVEAMASRVPVVGSDSGAVPEVIGDSGLVYPEGDVAALSAAIRLLLNDPLKRAQLAQAGLCRVRNVFSDEAIGRATLQVYRSVLGDA